MKFSFVPLLLLVLPLSAQVPAGYLDSLRALPDDTAKAQLFYEAIYRLANNNEVTADHFNEAIAIAERINHLDLQSRLLGFKGIYHYNMLEYDSSLAVTRRAMAVAERLGDPRRRWRHELDYAETLHYAGRYESSNRSAIDLLRSAEATSNDQNIGKALGLLGMNAMARGEYATAEDHYRRATQAARRADKPVNVAHYQAALGDVLLTLGRTTEALETGRTALDSLPEGFVQEEFQLYLLIGRAQTALGRHAAARRSLNRVLEIDSDDPSVLIAVADLLNRTGRYAASRDTLHLALVRARTLDNPAAISDIYLRLGDYQLSEAQQDSVDFYRPLMAAYRDTVQQRANQATSLELQEQYATAEREAEIAAQRLKIGKQRSQLLGTFGLLLLALGAGVAFYLLSRKLRRRNAENERLVTEKEALIGEIHHRVKNNLQVISSLLRLQQRELADVGARDALRESQGRVQAMGLIHEKLYQFDDVTSVHLPDYLKDLGDTLVDAYRLDERVDIFYDVEDVQLDVDTAIPLGLIINELLTNSLKYAFPDEREGTIEIALRDLSDGHYELTVADDGVGAPPTQTAPQGTGFGSHLIEMLSKRIGGSVTRSAAGGFATRLAFTTV